MLDKKEISVWVDGEISEFYWKFRDDLDDEGGRRLDEELDYFKKILKKIIENYPA